LSEQSTVVHTVASAITLVTGGTLAHTAFISPLCIIPYMARENHSTQPSVFVTAVSESHRPPKIALLPKITRQQSSIAKLNQSCGNSANSSVDLSRSRDTDASGRWEAFLKSRAKQEIVQGRT